MSFTLYTVLLGIAFLMILIMTSEDRDGPSDDQRGGGGGGRRLAEVPVRNDRGHRR